MPMHRIGFWPNTIYDDFCFPQELASCSDDATRREVLAYLRAARVDEAWRGYSYCRYDCGVPDERMGCADTTDGVWVWPAGLLHYVEEHQISLPDAFLATIRGERDAPPAPQPGEIFDFWRSWCASQRPKSSQALIAELKQQCEAESELRLAEEYDRITAERGTTDTKCMWQACTRRALKGIVYCAHHFYDTACGGEHGSVTRPLRLKYTQLFLSSL